MSLGDGILCPVCSGQTGVIETRPLVGEIRRRRRCLDRGCSGRVSTVEKSVEWVAPDMVLVSRRALKRLRLIVSELNSSSVLRESSCASPEESAIPVIE
jgi:transcriptional regulator NrdR family protein